MSQFSVANIYDLVAVLLLFAVAAGAVALRLRQPVLIGFIAAGIIVGPSVLGWVRPGGSLHFLAELGLAILLFVVGLKLDVGLIRNLGPVVLAAGTGQIIITAALGYLLALALGFSQMTSVYIALALVFSSTIIVVKLLSDKREADSLHGRIAVGVLIIQDIAVILIMIILTSIGGDENQNLGFMVLSVLWKGAALLVGLALLMYFVLPSLMNLFAGSSELLILFAIAWAVALAGLSATIGFSKEVGAFLAGVSLAPTLYREVLAARLVSVRDFLLLFFFVELGTRLNISLLGGQVWSAVALSAFALIVKPLIVMAIMGAIGYTRRTGLLVGLSLAQISEFSLLLAYMGLGFGYISANTVGVITLVGMLTIALSSYLIRYSHSIYDRLSLYLVVFERRVPHKEEMLGTEYAGLQKTEVILFGLGRYGGSIVNHLLDQERKILGIDFDPQVVQRWRQRGVPVRFGDAEDPEFSATLPLGEAKWVVSTVRDSYAGIVLTHSVRELGYNGNIALTAYSQEDVSAFRNAGAEVVFYPYTDAASQAVDIMNEAEQRELRKRMDRMIGDMRGHFIVCGYGRMGQQIVKDFRRYSVPHIVIEYNPEQITKLIAQEILLIEGSASDDEVLKRAGIERARGLVAVTATDEENVFIVLTARGLNPNLYIVARSILEENEGKLKRAGADRVISPYILGGRRIAAAVLKPRVMDFLDHVVYGDEPYLEVSDVAVSSLAPFVNKQLRESRIREMTGVTVLAVMRTGEQVHANPTPEFVILERDELIVLGTVDQVDAAVRFASGELAE